jgi:uncharacterized protein YutE (UPF0331/DUF86 family)
LVDPDVVRRRLRVIDRRVGALREVDRDAEAFIADTDLQALTERHLQVAIQAAIDIAFHLLAEDGGDTADDYGSAFTLLSRQGVISADLADQLRRAAGLRNILVHAYIEVDPKRLLAHLDRLDDLVNFSEHVESYLAARDA